MTLDVQREDGVSTKGPRGGVFVMYNCARLHTLFDSYERGVEKGELCKRFMFHSSGQRRDDPLTQTAAAWQHSLSLRI